MRVHGPRGDVGRLLPDQVEDVRARQRLVDVLEQQQRKIEFLLRETDRLVADESLLQVGVEAVAVEFTHHRIGVGGIGAAQQRADARAQDRRRYRLDHVVVGARVEDLGDTGLVVAAGHEDDRQAMFGLVLAHPLHQLFARQVGHVPVEHQQVEGLALQALLEHLAFAERITRVTDRRQRLADEVRLRLVVVQYSNSHNTRNSATAASRPAFRARSRVPGAGP